MTNYGKYILLIWLLAYNWGCGLIKPNEAPILKNEDLIAKPIEKVVANDGVANQDQRTGVQLFTFDEGSSYIALALAEGWYGGKYATPLECYVKCVGGQKGVNLTNFAFDVILSSSVGGLVEQTSWEISEEGVALTNHIRNQFREFNNGKDFHIGGPNKTQYIYTPLKEVIITANTKLWGVESGGNLVGNFAVTETVPSFLFSYPDGNILNTSDCEDLLPVLSQSLTPLRMRFSLTEPFAERPQKVVYTIKVLLKDNITLEHKFSIKYEYK